MGESQKWELPKHYIELHLHLDGAITPDIALELASLQGISLPAEDEKGLESLLSLPEGCRSLNDFLKCFKLPLSLLQSKEVITRAVELVLENECRQNVIYAELRFAPQLHTKGGLSQRQVILAALDGIKRADIPCNLILCCMRGEGNGRENEETVRLAEEFLVKNGGVTALDLAGAEQPFPTKNYRTLFKLAAEKNIPFTIHAGEAAGAESVRCAVEMGAARIGHGVRIFKDEPLMDIIQKRCIPLEMCPISNLRTCALEDGQAYPLKMYLERGIKATLNTDDPGILKNTLADEFAYARDVCQVTGEQEQQLLFNSVDAAFTDEATKKMLRERLGEPRGSCHTGLRSCQ